MTDATNNNIEAIASDPNNQENPALPANEGGPEAKRLKTDAGEGEAAEPAAAGDGTAAGDTADDNVDGDVQAEPVVERDPVQIGYKSFTSGNECYKYFQNIISKYRKNQNLNDYEYHMVHELIRTGHPDADRKLADGVKFIQIRNNYTNGVESSCFYLIRETGASEDVSYRKCIAALFPEMKELVAKQGERRDVGKSSGGRGGRGRGRGGRGRGRGGRRGGGRRGGAGRN